MALAAQAHHSYSEFDDTQSVEVEGKLVEVAWQNPHARIVVQAKDAAGKPVTWEIESAGLNGVKGVWCHEAGAIRMFIVVAIEQQHPGHAQQAGMLVAGCHSGNYAGRWIVVVDSDIDPANLDDVIWAMSTRCDPVADIEYIKRAWSTPLDPMLRTPPWENTRAIVNACRLGTGGMKSRKSPPQARSGARRSKRNGRKRFKRRFANEIRR